MNKPQGVEEKFYDEVCPGIVPSVTAFEYTCAMFLDFELWEEIQAVKESGMDMQAAVSRLKRKVESFEETPQQEYDRTEFEAIRRDEYQRTSGEGC